MLIIDRLTKSKHLIPIRDDINVDRLGHIYIRKMVRLHREPMRYLLNRDTWLVSTFWLGLQEALGTRLSFNTIYHPQTDGQIKRVNHIIEDILKACCLDHRVNWINVLPLVEFAYNNNY